MVGTTAVFAACFPPRTNKINGLRNQKSLKSRSPRSNRITSASRVSMREAFGRLGGRTLIAWDGTQYFCSQKLGCRNCLTRERSNGKTENYHCLLSATVVAPGHSKVVPLMPAFVVTHDGAEKQDCERDAVKRWFAEHGARLEPLRPIFLGDDLFACELDDILCASKRSASPTWTTPSSTKAVVCKSRSIATASFHQESPPIRRLEC